MAGDDLPAGAEHEVVGEVWKDLEVGAVGLRRPLHLARREDPVLAPADDQHRQPGHDRRPGQREGHHVEVGEVGLVLQSLVERPGLRLAHGAAEEQLLGERGCLDDRPQAHREVGPEELERVAAEDPQGGEQRTGRGHRRDQHRGRCGVAFEVLLDDQAAHRVADHDRWLGQRGGRFRDVRDVLGDPCPAKALTPRRTAMAAQVDRLHGPAAVAEVAEEMLLPAPGAVPGTVHEQKRRHKPSNLPR